MPDMADLLGDVIAKLKDEGSIVVDDSPPQFEPELLEAAIAGKPVAAFTGTAGRVTIKFVPTTCQSRRRAPQGTSRSRRSRSTTRRLARASSSDDPGLADPAPPPACGLRGWRRWAAAESPSKTSRSG
jgi:hypothetical protein